MSHPEANIEVSSLSPPPTSKRRRRNPTTSIVCRTCSQIKCDGTQDGCSNCTSSSQECIFPVDGRRESTRTTKADFQALQDELKSVRALLQAQSPPIPRNSGEHLQDQNVPRNLDNSPPNRVKDTSRTRWSAPASGLGEERRTNGLGTQALSPSEARLAGTISETGELQVHGITSTLHQSTETDIHQERYDSADTNNVAKEIAKAQLISNAAIQRQCETTLIRQPGLNIDFDGRPPDLAFHLLDLHWNSQHFSFLLSYRPVITDSLINKGSYCNRLLLNAIYYSSSLHSNLPSLRSDPSDPSTTGLQFYQRFKQLLPEYIDKASIPTAVALLLCGASLVSHGKQSAGWILCGTAYRHLIDLGCHLSIQIQDQPTTKSTKSTKSKEMVITNEMKRRLYWGAYMTDKFQSLYLGRTPVLKGRDTRVPREYLDTFEELEEWKPYSDFHSPSQSPSPNSSYTPRPAYATTTALALVGLAEVIEMIIDEFYSIGSIKTLPDVLLRSKAEIQPRLISWKMDLPPHLHFEPGVDETPPPHQITPHAMYFTTLILLERPFLETGHLAFAADSTSPLLSEERCEGAAVKIWHLLKAYKETFTLRHAPYLISYAAYSAALDIEEFDAEGGAPSETAEASVEGGGMERSSEQIHDVTDSSSNINAEFNTEGMEHAGFEMLGEVDLWNQTQWLETIVTDQGLLSDSMYGMFTPDDGNILRF
ncbi:uncharacterized protein PAC_07378 [Phialocephala subalpina]|uniref:Xylanolytic transcriptional activator regulatory domain-containing protein n=1 Tax=Phialocephala subalpina TaxID=576137 RepID=A0A1L7WXK2_9HELO|nr:uncharacterized protein PAC_07378 [Phialocephala subalpina]